MATTAAVLVMVVVPMTTIATVFWISTGAPVALEICIDSIAFPVYVAIFTVRNRASETWRMSVAAATD